MKYYILIKANVPTVGWHKLLLGDFSNDNNLIFDEMKIYVK